MPKTLRNSLFALLLVCPQFGFGAEKLIALTFDDGPRPYVLYGTKTPRPARGLIDVLDEQHINATFFVMGWRLTPHTWGEPRHETNIGVSCVEAVQRLVKRGDEIEDHTFSHEQLQTAERKKGESWVVGDVEHGAQLIQAVSGVRPRYLRPPDWILPDDARRDIEGRGFHVLTISASQPMAMRDVNSLDYLCAGTHPRNCPQPSLAASVLRQIEQRERKGVYTHILTFHELSTTTAVLPGLISELKGRGYRFVTINDYMKEIVVTPLAERASNSRLRPVSDKSTKH
jgi:peptidoglycan/xylan/chitin deacetylase (PgdA/CDA1 family)